MKIAVLTSQHIPCSATPPPDAEVVEYTYHNPFVGEEPVTWRIADLIAAATGIRAVEDGCDAIMCNALSDFGEAILRDLVKGPVVGAARAVSAAAETLGDRFTLIDAWPPAACGVVNQRFRDYGIYDKIVSMRFLADDEMMADGAAVGKFFGDVTTCDIAYVERVRAAIDATVVEDKPHAILLGCTCMSAAAAGLNDRSPVPVLDASQVALDLAATLGRRHGPLTLNEEAGRFWNGSLAGFIRSLGETAMQLDDEMRALASATA